MELAMTNPSLRTPFGAVELTPVAAPEGAPEGMQAFVLLPELDELLGVPGFGLRDPILLTPRRKGLNSFWNALYSLAFH
jgi:hypothetical protein